MSNQIKSVSVQIKPEDSRCRYWAKIIRKDAALPLPSTVEGANDIPAPYSRKGDEELFEGDVMIEGEEMHHRKARGWTYAITFIGADGEARRVRPGSEIKATLKANGLEPALLAGSGDVAACIRIAHAIRAGIAF